MNKRQRAALRLARLTGGFTHLGHGVAAWPADVFAPPALPPGKQRAAIKRRKKRTVAVTRKAKGTP